MKSAQILIIDKIGLIGEPLSQKLSKEFDVVFVRFAKRIPAIPDNKYSHIILINDEEKEPEFLSKIIEKVKKTNADFIFAKELCANANYQINRVLKLYPGSKIVLYGDIFDDKLIQGHDFKSTVNKFIYQAKKFHRIQIPGNGLEKTYPVLLEDVVDSIIDIFFGINKNHSLFYVFPRPYITELSLAHMIQKANPQVVVDFVKQTFKKENISIPPHGKYLLSDRYPLAKKIRNINIKKSIVVSEKRNNRKGLKKTMHLPFISFFILIFLIFSPLFFTMLFSFLGLNTFYFGKKELEKGNMVIAKSSLHLSQTFFYTGKKASDVLFLEAKAFGLNGNLNRLLEDIDLGYRLSEGLFQAFDSESYFTKVFNGRSENPIDDFTKGRNKLKQAVLELERIKAEGKVPKTVIEKIESIGPLIKLFSATSDILPNIFGMDRGKTYLILFQDSTTLRPGGGLIESYGILKLDKGRITEFSINDVSDADKQLRGHVEPPFAIRRHLPSIHWYLQDSNFDIDFAKTASSASNFLFAETGQKADGVIGINISLAKNILKAIGPIDVAGFKEEVSEENIYMLAKSHAEKDFLRAVYKSIFAKIAQEKIPYFLLAIALSDSLSQKHLMLTMNDSSQNIFAVNGWSSSMFDEREEGRDLVNDYLGINEANLGNNKINYFIKREVSQKVIINNDGNISEELNVNYKNTSKSLPQNNYKNYLRIILPPNTQIAEVLINDEVQVLADAVTDPLVYEAKNFKNPEGLEIERVDENNKTIYGFLVNILAGEEVSVKIKYNLPKNISGQNHFSYNLKLLKQPGVDEMPYFFSLTFPNDFDVVKGQTSFSEKITEDKNLIIDFVRK